MLFKGEQSDSIYMEVEHRRLSFLKETFSRGNQAVDNGRALTYASRFFSSTFCIIFSCSIVISVLCNWSILVYIVCFCATV